MLHPDERGDSVVMLTLAGHDSALHTVSIGQREIDGVVVRSDGQMTDTFHRRTWNHIGLIPADE